MWAPRVCTRCASRCVYTVACQRGPRQRRAIVIAPRARHYVRVIAAVDSALVTFRLADPGRELADVRLRQDAGLAGDRLESTTRFAAELAGKHIRHELDLWGHDVPHDWPSWRAQLAHHMPRFC